MMLGNASRKPTVILPLAWLIPEPTTRESVSEQRTLDQRMPRKRSAEFKTC
jgi:hypothetical protein